MPILIPTPTPTAPYPVVNDAMNLARTRINDAIVSIGGEMLMNSQPYSQVMVNGAWLRMRQYMATMGCSRVKKRTVLTGFPIVASQDPGSEYIICWSYVFDGVSYWVPPNTPVLPQDLIAPLEVKERQSSGYQPILTEGYRGFTRMSLSPVGENLNWRKRPWNGVYDWRDDKLVMPGSTSPMDLEIYYSAKLMGFDTVGNVTWDQQPIPFVQGESALAYWLCHEFAIGRADMDAQSWLTLGQSDCRDLINTSDVPLRQRWNVSRRSYGGGSRSGRDGFSGGY